MQKNRLLNFIKMLGIFIGATILCWGLDMFKVDVMNFMIIYVLGIMVCSIVIDGFLYSIVISLLSVLGFNFFFTIPRYSFKIDDPKYIVTIVLVVLVGIIVSSIVYKLKNYTRRVNDMKIEQIKLKSEMEKEQIKSTMLRGISHDLRTPLTTIKNGVGFILNSEVPLAEKKELGKRIEQKCDWTIRLMNNLLSLTRINEKNFTVKKNNELVEEIIPEAMRSVEDLIGNRKIHYDIPTELLIVPMDGILIIQVIANILSNAIRYTSDNGNIWIKVWNSGRQSIFRISNDGAPIKEEDLPHIFELYYSTDQKSGNEYGLGLAICKMIIEAHKGTIEARNLNERVVFEFSLPLEEVYNEDFVNM